MGKSIERKAWEVFSKYIRLKYATDLKLVKCFTCDYADFYDKFDCGHFIDRRYKSVMYDEMNNHPQCRRCNRELDGNIDEYYKRLVEKYGEEAVKMLEEKSKRMEKPDHHKIYDVYKRRLDFFSYGKFRVCDHPYAFKLKKFETYNEYTKRGRLRSKLIEGAIVAKREADKKKDYELAEMLSNDKTKSHE